MGLLSNTIANIFFVSSTLIYVVRGLTPTVATKGSGSVATDNSASATASSATSSGSSSSGSSGTSSSGGSISYDQFCKAVAAYSKTSAGGTPPCPGKDVYDAYIQKVGSVMSTKEQAMFLANAIWETGGLKYLKEIACSNGSCTYGKYYGRGYLQLTWDYNYKKASQEIYKDNSLVDNPDKAAQQPGAWQTAVWYWTAVVSPALKQRNAVDTYKLGYSVKAINGALECGGGPNQKAKNRLAIYNEILKVFNIASNNPGTLEGCS